MTPLDQLLKALNKRPIFETIELKEDLKPHIPYLAKDPKTFQKLLQEIDKSQTIEQLKDLLMDADYNNPDSDLVDIFNNIEAYLAGPYKDQDIWDLYETLALWCNDAHKVAKAKCKNGETPFSYHLHVKNEETYGEYIQLILLTPSFFREFNLTEEDIVNIYNRYDTLEDILNIIDSDPEDLTNASKTIQQFYNALKIMVETGNDISPICPIFQKLKKEKL
jgi:hypothetical protein